MKFEVDLTVFLCSIANTRKFYYFVMFNRIFMSIRITFVCLLSKDPMPGQMENLKVSSRSSQDRKLVMSHGR